MAALDNEKPICWGKALFVQKKTKDIFTIIVVILNFPAKIIFGYQLFEIKIYFFLII